MFLWVAKYCILPLRVFDLCWIKMVYYINICVVRASLPTEVCSHRVLTPALEMRSSLSLVSREGVLTCSLRERCALSQLFARVLHISYPINTLQRWLPHPDFTESKIGRRTLNALNLYIPHNTLSVRFLLLSLLRWPPKLNLRVSLLFYWEIRRRRLRWRYVVQISKGFRRFSL